MVGMKYKPPVTLLLLLLLITATLAAYWPVTTYPFLELDDNIYVTKNHHVRSGITIEGIKAAFSFTTASEKVYYHPLSILSHMLDVQLFGLKPTAHHLMNVIYHILNSILLFFFLKQATGAVYRSAMVAILFALHPLNVESVAWIAERKNLISTGFWFLSCLAYVHYSRRSTIRNYIPVFVGMLLGLLAKPMLVTLPFAFLLMDFWPLKRIQFSVSDISPRLVKAGLSPTLIHSIAILLKEKIPLFLLSAAWVYIATLSAEKAGQIISTQVFPLTLRIQNALYSYFAYILKIFFPFDLAVFYPFPAQAYPVWQLLGALLFVLLITSSIIGLIRSAPYLFTGWCWFLGTLVPVLGIKQQGLWPAMADRWTYLPAVGIFIMIAWGLHQIYSKTRSPQQILLPLAILSLLFMAFQTRIQLGFWKDDLSLAGHSLKVTRQNHVAHHLLGLALLAKDQKTEGIKHVYEAVKIGPQYNTPRITLGGILAESGKPEQAIEQLQIALRINPNVALAHNNLGVAYKKMGKLDRAGECFEKALQLDPYFTDAHNNIANILKMQKRLDEALQFYQRALRIDNGIPEIHNNIGNTFLALHRLEEAITHYRQAIQISPNQPVFYANLAEALLNKGDISGAISNYLIAEKYAPDNLSIQKRLDELKLLQNQTH